VRSGTQGRKCDPNVFDPALAVNDPPIDHRCARK